jgi:hypothetical protein
MALSLPRLRSCVDSCLGLLGDRCSPFYHVRLLYFGGLHSVSESPLDSRQQPLVSASKVLEPDSMLTLLRYREIVVREMPLRSKMLRTAPLTMREAVRII